MAAESMSTALASVSSRKEKAAKALSSLSSYRNLMSSCITDWQELERSFGVTERALQQKFKELAEREKEFDSRMEEARAVLDKREESIAGREQTSLARVKEQKDTAIAAILEERKKLGEERMKKKEEKMKETDVSGPKEQREKKNSAIVATGHEEKQKGEAQNDLTTGADHEETKEMQRKGGQKKVHALATDHEEMKKVEKKEAQNDTVKDAHSEEKKEVQEKESQKKDGQKKDVEKKEGQKKAVEKKEVQEKEPQKKDGQKKDVEKKEGQKKAVEKKEVQENEPPKKDGQKKDEGQKKAVQKKEGQDEDLNNKRKDTKPAVEAVAKRLKEASPSVGTTVKGSNNESSNGATTLEEAINQVKIASEAQFSMQIRSFVEKMDGEGLREFLVHHRKETPELRAELQAALQASSDPCYLVLKALEGSEDTKRVSVNNKGCHACILLLESLSEVLADPVLGSDYPVVPSDARELAKTLARGWQSKLKLHGRDDYTLDAHLFLQLLATFGIGTEYSDDELLTYVVSMSRRGIGPALCRTLGLTERIPVLVDKLAKEGKQIEAIAFASSYGILEKYNPGSLLKSYLDDSQKAAQLLVEKAATKAAALNDAHMKQMTALKNAVKVIEEYNLSSYLPLEDLRRRIVELEKEKAERKKANATPKQERKLRKSAHESESGRLDGVNTVEVGTDVRQGHDDSGLAKPVSSARALDRGHYVPTDLGRSIRGEYIPTDLGQSFLSSYGLTSQYKFERRPESAYSSGYGFGSRSPVSLPNPYSYPSIDGIGSSLSGTASHVPTTSYPGIPGSNSSYQLGTGLPPSSSYLPFYLR